MLDVGIDPLVLTKTQGPENNGDRSEWKEEPQAYWLTSRSNPSCPYAPQAEQNWGKPKLPPHHRSRVVDFVVSEESLLHLESNKPSDCPTDPYPVLELADSEQESEGHWCNGDLTPTTASISATLPAQAGTRRGAPFRHGRTTRSPQCSHICL